ncbi:MAG: amino acid permease [Terriglobales bacterium]
MATATRTANIPQPSLPAAPRKKSIRLTLWPLVAATFFMVSGGTYGTEDIVHGAGYGKAILILLLTPILWSLPTAFMIGELASALPAEGGYYAWVRRAMGNFWMSPSLPLPPSHSPLSLTTPALTGRSPVSPIIPALTQNIGGGGTFEPSTFDFEPLFSPNSTHSRTIGNCCPTSRTRSYIYHYITYPCRRADILECGGSPPPLRVTQCSQSN